MTSTSHPPHKFAQSSVLLWLVVRNQRLRNLAPSFLRLFHIYFKLKFETQKHKHKHKHIHTYRQAARNLIICIFFPLFRRNSIWKKHLIEIVALQWCYLLTNVLGQPIGPIFKGQAACSLKIGTVCPETSTTNHHSKLRNTAEERRSHLHPNGSLKSRLIFDCSENGLNLFLFCVIYYVPSIHNIYQDKKQ